jgi:hypothetical protein
MSALPPAIGNAAASHALGYMINTLFYGTLILQTYIYYVAFPNDKKGIKALVYSLFALETLQTAFMMHDGMVALGFGFGNPEALIKVHLAWFSVPILSSFVSCIVQSFFAWRIYVLSNSIPAAALVVAAALLQFGAGIVQGVKSYQIDDFTRLPVLPLKIWLITAAATDVVIAIFMAYNLSKKQTGFKKTDVLLTRLIRMTIETGTATAVMAIITAGLFLALPTLNYFVAPSYVLGKLYVNNLMMIFNSRMHIVGSRNGSPTEVSQLSYSNNTRLGTTDPSKSFGSTAETSVRLQVTTQQDISPGNSYDMKPLGSVGSYQGYNSYNQSV